MWSNFSYSHPAVKRVLKEKMRKFSIILINSLYAYSVHIKKENLWYLCDNCHGGVGGGNSLLQYHNFILYFSRAGKL